MILYSYYSEVKNVGFELELKELLAIIQDILIPGEREIKTNTNHIKIQLDHWMITLPHCIKELLVFSVVQEFSFMTLNFLITNNTIYDYYNTYY